MRRVKLGYDVFDAAVNRLVSVYEQGHTVVVSMSGGKDSGICLELALIAAEMTGSLPVNACVRDEEVAYPGTFEYLERVAARPEVNFKWFVCRQPMVNVFNRGSPYFWCFDKLLEPSEWVREYPSYAIENPTQNIESIVHPRWFPVPEGKHLVDVIGLRVSESAKRLLGLVSSRGYMTSIEKRGGVPYQRCRPVYDWTDSDVWRAFKENGWDYNRAYDIMVRMGIPKKQLRIGPPTMSVYAADALKMASKAWPRWFDRVCERLPGVRQAGHFGKLAATPRRRRSETWEQCYHRLCIDGAPAEWIADRSIRLKEHWLAAHARHSNGLFPQISPCMNCGGGATASWKSMCMIMYNGDPFSLKLGGIEAVKFPYMEPEFFRPGSGTWDGTPSW